MAKEKKPITEKTIWEDAQRMLQKAENEQVETAWDRLEYQQPHCKFCELGTTCRNCTMGPCRISDKEGSKMRLGVCGADAHVVVARNFGRFIAGGSAGHSDHGRDLVEVLEAVAEGTAPGYGVRDEKKLRLFAAEFGVNNAETRPVLDVAGDLASACFEEFGSRKKALTLINRVPQKRRDIWDKFSMTPRGIDREISEMMHRTHMGCDNDAVSLLCHAARTSLADGWGGSLIGTELSDVLFGTPTPSTSSVNLGVIKKDYVNVLVHGHNPVVSEMVLAASREPAMIEAAKKAGAKGINVAGLCCTGNELMMRQGIPMAGNHLMTELAIVTGAVEAVVVDYQCIMPSMVQVAACYHTKFISTSPKGRFTGATHIEVTCHDAQEKCREIVQIGIDAFTRRDPNRVDIPATPVPLMTGFSNESILAALGGTPKPLIDAIVANNIRGVVGIVGCNNPKYKHDSCNVRLTEELIKRNILVLATGCVTTAVGKAGLLMPEAAAKAGSGLAAVCNALGIPPVLHMGSCVDNSRIISLCALLANELGVDISDLPVAASSPEWYSEKAAAIGLYAVASGIPTHLGHAPNILGSSVVTDVAVNQLNNIVGAAFIIEPDPVKAADALEASINARRQKLGLSI